MIHVFRLLDKPGATALRQRVRPEHKACLGAMAERIAFAGPLKHDDGVTMIGSLLAIDFESRDAARAWLVTCARRSTRPTTSSSTRSPARTTTVPPCPPGLPRATTTRRHPPCASSAMKAGLRTMEPKAGAGTRAAVS